MVERLIQTPPQKLRYLELPNTHLERQISPEITLLAANKLSNWVVGLSEGHLGSIYFFPKESTRAQITFQEYIPPETLGYMIAAGAVDVPTGKSLGFGKDMFMVDRLSGLTGIDGKFAKSKAQAILASYDTQVLKRGVEIMAYLAKDGREFSGEEIVSILEKAKQELFLEGEKVNLTKKIAPQDRILTEVENEVIETKILDLGGSLKVIYLKKDGTEEVMEICRACGGYDENHNQAGHGQINKNTLNQEAINFPPQKNLRPNIPIQLIDDKVPV